MTAATAADVYRQALSLRRELGEDHRVVEPLAGLAEVAQTAGEAGRSLALVEEILPQLLENKMESVEEPFRVYLACYRVLAASQDPRRQSILARARAMLAVRAAKISDEEVRHTFLENVPAHREILGLAHSQPAATPE